MKDNLLDALKQLLINSVDQQHIEQLISEDSLQEEQSLEINNIRNASNQSFRVLDWSEKDRFSEESLKYLYFLEQIGILSYKNREQLLEQLLATDTDTITPSEIKWAILGLLDDVLSIEEQTFLDFVLSKETNSRH